MIRFVRAYIPQNNKEDSVNIKHKKNVIYNLCICRLWPVFRCSLCHKEYSTIQINNSIALRHKNWRYLFVPMAQ